jgi:hypothetical protein
MEAHVTIAGWLLEEMKSLGKTMLPAMLISFFVLGLKLMYTEV